MCSTSHSLCGREHLTSGVWENSWWHLPRPWKKCLETRGCGAQDRATWDFDGLGIYQFSWRSCGAVNSYWPQGREEQFDLRVSEGGAEEKQRAFKILLCQVLLVPSEPEPDTVISQPALTGAQ